MLRFSKAVKGTLFGRKKGVSFHGSATSQHLVLAEYPPKKRQRGICFYQVEAVPSSEELQESVDFVDTMEVAPPPSSEMLVSSGFCLQKISNSNFGGCFGI